MVHNREISATVLQNGDDRLQDYDKYAYFCTVYESYAALSNLIPLHIYQTTLPCKKYYRFLHRKHATGVSPSIYFIHGNPLPYRNDLQMAILCIFYWHVLSFIPARISNYTHYDMWDKIINPFQTLTVNPWCLRRISYVIQ